MMDPIRRKILKTGAAATVMAASTPRARATGWAGTSCRVLLRKRSHSYPLRQIRLRFPATAHRRRRTELDDRRPHSPFNAIEELGAHRCIAADLRNAYSGRSTGPSRSTGRGMPIPMTISV